MSERGIEHAIPGSAVNVLPQDPARPSLRTELSVRPFMCAAGSGCAAMYASARGVKIVPGATLEWKGRLPVLYVLLINDFIHSTFRLTIETLNLFWNLTEQALTFVCWSKTTFWWNWVGNIKGAQQTSGQQSIFEYIRIW